MPLGHQCQRDACKDQRIVWLHAVIVRRASAKANAASQPHVSTRRSRDWPGSDPPNTYAALRDRSRELQRGICRWTPWQRSQW